ncbi:protein transport protein Sec16B [Aulostomus maculatus]
MDHRGHRRPESGRHHHKSKDREDPRYSHLDMERRCPLADSRERSRNWVHADAHYRAHFTGPPPARPQQYPYNPQQYSYNYGPPEHQRPQSRHGYDYTLHSHWDYREAYTYYDHDYYGRQQGRKDAGQWVPQDLWRNDFYHERSSRQEYPESYRTEEYRNDQLQDTSQPYLKDYYEDNPSKENEEVSYYYSETLDQSKNSGLSSSSCELSQYMNGADSDNAPQPDHATVDHTSAPLKYSIPHVVVSFGPAGQLIRVAPGFSMQEHINQVELHSLEVILSETQEQQEIRNFPGPLTREDLHKVDAIEFAQQMAGSCLRDDKLHDRSSAALLWKLLILLCRQNGQIVGSDIAELLMQGSHSNGSWGSETPTLIDFSEGKLAEAPPCQEEDLLTGTSIGSETSKKALQGYTQLLLAGRKKEALELAMSSDLWGHALFLASKMDNRAYTTVLNRFTGQLTASDPLQTLFQLLSGRIPSVAMCCGNEKWGDWRPHLAVMLSNETSDHSVQQKAIITMGDTLASRGLLHAAHVCYLSSSVPFGVFTQMAARMVLLGSSHRQSFGYFATNAAIQCTELYEYCQTLGGKCFSIPSFQVYKFVYASRLLDCGLASQAFHYCEVVGQAILRQKEPFFVLTGEIIKLADRLRHTEGQYSEAGLSGAGPEPKWLAQLRARLHHLQMGDYLCTEAHRSPSEEPSSINEDNKIPSGSDVDDLRGDIKSPEPEFLYYRDPGDQDNPVNPLQDKTEEIAVLSWGVRGTQDWSQAISPKPGPLAYASTTSTGSGTLNFTYHNTDTAEVGPASPHCPGAGLSSGTGMMESEVLEVGINHQGQMQQSMQQHLQAPERTEEPSEQSNKVGWFSGWFKSKSTEAQKQSSEQRSPAQTVPPSTGFCAPPPPTIVPPAMIPSQPSSSGINPFSRKAGQQLG